jgi:hypothetical protein
MGDLVPEAVEMGYHYCYGNRDGKRQVEPADCSLVVECANGVAEAIGRRVDWIHIPITSHGGAEQFAPLRNLRADAATRVYLGLVTIPDDIRLSSPFGGDSPVRKSDLDAGAAEVDHRDQRVGGVESVCAV